MKVQLYTLFLFLTLLLLGSCLSEEEFDASGQQRLRFSVDTLSLDTIIAGQPTNTYTLQVYNPQAKSIRINHISLAKGAQSAFRVNIDGTYLKDGQASDFEIAARDSIRVFIEATAPITQLDSPQPIEDALQFHLTPSISQQVVLKAMGQDVITLKAHTLHTDTVLSDAKPYQILDSLVVAEGTMLRLAAGVRLYFQTNASLIVRGKLIAEGTLQQPVIFRGNRLGYMFSQQPYDRIPNQWGGIYIAPSSKDNHLNYCDIHSGAYGIHCEGQRDGVRQLLLENSIIHNTAGYGLQAIDTHLQVGNSQITNTSGDCVYLLGGTARFVHTTIAQFYPFVGGRGVALHLSNRSERGNHPLENAEFTNCIITGRNEDELQGEQAPKEANTVFNYRFSHCLLNTPKPEKDDNFQQCIFEEAVDKNYRQSKQFVPAFDFAKLLFSFLLHPKSGAVGKADVATTAASYPHDRLGRPRLADGNADLGCYEAQTED